MSYNRSITIGVVLIVAVFLLSVLIFYMSQGTCPIGYFACNNGTEECVPQRKICDRKIDCADASDEDPVECGMFYGSTAMIGKIMTEVLNISVEAPNVVRNSCDIENYPREQCDCLFESYLICARANLTEVPRKLSTEEVKRLFLSENQILLTNYSFQNLSLEVIQLDKNNLTEIPGQVFADQVSLEKLLLSDNTISRLPPDIFKGLVALKWLFLDNLQLLEIDLNIFADLQSLYWLDLSSNRLDLIGQTFPKLDDILELFLDNNRLTTVDENLFSALSSLHLLSLNNNRIESIHTRALSSLVDLRELRLANNRFTQLPSDIFVGTPNLDALNLANNSVRVEAALLHNINLSFLDLEGIDFENIDFDVLSSMTALRFVTFKEFFYCTMTPMVKKCRPNSDGISSLENLLTNKVLRMSAWVMGAVTCLGNGLVLWGRFTFRGDENQAVSMVIRNLAVADILMGVYLLAIGVQDSRFRNHYHEASQDWLASWNCVAAGVLAMISSEVSMLILAFMSVERFLLISDPFGGHRRLNTQNGIVSMLAIWLSGCAIAVFPVIHWRSSTRFYGLHSGICFPFHLQGELGWQYSAFVFLGVNLTLLLLIATLYTALLVSICRTRQATPLPFLDCEFAIRFFFIVLTGASCWAPIIGMKLLALMSGYLISAEVYAYLVVFVLPLNSAINPLLYTFTTPKYRGQILTTSRKRMSRRQQANGGYAGGSNPDESQAKIIPLLYTTTVTSTWK